MSGARQDGRRPLLRHSLRANAVLMVLAMLVLPQAIVVGWSMMERDIGGRLQHDARASVEEAVSVLATVPSSSFESRLADVTSQWGTRIRVVRDDGTVVADVDADRGTDLVHQVGTLFFGPDGAPTLHEFDETLGPVASRKEVSKATGWQTSEPARAPLPEGTARYPASPSASNGGVETGCRTSPAGKLLLCHAAAVVTIDERPHVVYAQESSRRAVRVLYDLRYHLARLSIVMLPFALAFSWWMGRRMVRPIEWLRARVLEKAKSANPRADIDLRGGDEVRDLAEAFNDLLGSLDDRRRANEAFVADLVHEFKNPIAAIRACSESLGSGSADEKRAARLAKILEDSSGRLDALVSQFLELARAEAGMPKEDRGEVDLAALARGITTAVEPAFPDVRFVVEGELGTCVLVGVSSRLDSLVRNLVDNAASFAGPGGEVRVVVRRDERDEARDAPAMVIEVSDTGPGVADADLPRVFDRFYTTRALPPAGEGENASHSSRAKGSGLGLALVKAVAEAHGGEASAVSPPGKGATFRVTLPCRGDR